MEEFDVVVIGAGPGGYVCAIRAAQLGFKTACIESRPALGGTCLNVGCIPSKAMLESSHHFHRARHELADHGIGVERVSLDLGRMLSRKDSVVSGITKGVEQLFVKNKIARIVGRGRLLSPGVVAIDLPEGGVREVRSRHVVIATGSEPVELRAAPFDHRIVVDSTDALSFSQVPERLVVVGGGVIGLELGSVWARLGSQVSVIEAMPRILPMMDAEVSSNMERILARQGLAFHTGTRLEEVKVEAGKAKVVCRKGEQGIELEAEKVLVAVGRRPFTAGLGLAEVGVACDERGRIVVDAHFATGVPGVFAIGDVIPGPMLAHKAEEEGIALAEMLAGHAGHVNVEAIPNVVYTWPEVASVGLGEEDCRERGLAFRKGKFLFRANGRAKAMGEVEGFVKVICDAASDRLLGVHILGPNASELIAEAAIAFEFRASAEDLARSVHAHPTLAEAIKEAALATDGRAIHS